MGGRLRRLVLLQRPVDHVDEAAGAGIVGSLDHVHQTKPVLTAGKIGKPPDGAGGVFADGFLITGSRLADAREQHDVVAGEQRFAGGFDGREHFDACARWN